MPNQRFLDEPWPPHARSPQSEGPKPNISEWGMLVRGKTLGKSCIVSFAPPAYGIGRVQNSPVNMLELQGDDEYAQAVSLVVSPPKVLLPLGTPVPDNNQNASGTQDNVQALGYDPAISPQFANPIVIVEWGIGGASNQVEADILNGLVLNLSCSFLRIKAQVETVGATTSNMVYQLSAFVGPGRPKDVNAQRTVIVAAGLGDGVESSPQALPRFAKRVSIQGGIALGNTFVGRIRFWRDNVGAASTLPNGEILFSANNLTPQPIPNGSYYFTIVNQSGVAITPAMAVFELSI